MFFLGSKSRANFYMVHPSLIKVAEDAIKITRVDFGIFEGLRTVDKERDNIAKGVSFLKDPRDCKHCPQKDGFSHAIDAVPFIAGAYQWTWPECYEIAKAFQASALQFGVRLRWGGVWDKLLVELSHNLDDEVEAYRKRHIGKDNLDGVHYELMDNIINDTTNDKALIA